MWTNWLRLGSRDLYHAIPQPLTRNQLSFGCWSKVLWGVKAVFLQYRVNSDWALEKILGSRRVCVCRSFEIVDGVLVTLLTLRYFICYLFVGPSDSWFMYRYTQFLSGSAKLTVVRWVMYPRNEIFNTITTKKRTKIKTYIVLSWAKSRNFIG